MKFVFCHWPAHILPPREDRDLLLEGTVFLEFQTNPDSPRLPKATDSFESLDRKPKEHENDPRCLPPPGHWDFSLRFRERHSFELATPGAMVRGCCGLVAAGVLPQRASARPTWARAGVTPGQDAAPERCRLLQTYGGT